ncbi:N-acetyltransferase [Acidihalobacter prosperus]|uniref:N-acetyltransferase domain-containing protein n=1 Tax=Acidihalobacter prosperus TaxID=160660 RepID=A0A1A6C0B2_9GAMM|nr:hypothetical protein [Acidihalobacter prosperus]OBS07994.1 hypothetical protein Thpro_022244 [Acidihalobacter prosperus]
MRRPLSLSVFKTNERARRLYERMGFVIHGEEEYFHELVFAS